MSFFLLPERTAPHFLFCHMPIFPPRAFTLQYKGFTGCTAEKNTVTMFTLKAVSYNTIADTMENSPWTALCVQVKKKSKTSQHLFICTFCMSEKKVLIFH